MNRDPPTATRWQESKSRTVAGPALRGAVDDRYFRALTNAAPFGVPRPVTSS